MDLKGKCEEMAGMPPEGSQFDARRYDAKMNDLITSDGQDFFTSYDEVYNSFDSMELQENLSRGIYAYGYEKPSAIQQREFFPFCNPTGAIWYLKKTLTRCKKHKVSRTHRGSGLGGDFFVQYAADLQILFCRHSLLPVSSMELGARKYRQVGLQRIVYSFHLLYPLSKAQPKLLGMPASRKFSLGSRILS